MFLAVIGRDQSIAPAQKLYYLRSKVRGEAYQAIKDFDLVDDNFNLAWEKLKIRFENKRLLVQDQIKKIHAVSPAQNETMKSLRYLQNTVNDCLAILNNYQIELHDYDPLLIHVVVSKLSDETIKEWESSLKNHRELPTWTKLNAFFTDRIEILETMSDRKWPMSRENNSSRTQSFHTVSETTPNCKICKQNHPLRTCKSFRSMSPNDRIKYVFANKYCVNCLSPNHYKSKCMSTNSCSICRKKHHTMLHFSSAVETKQIKSSGSHSQPDFKKDENNSNSNTQTKTSTFNTQVKNSLTIDRTMENNTQAYFVHHKGTTLLPTALIRIENARQGYTIRALLDSGAERSFITEHVQQELGLPFEKQACKISGFAGTVVGNSKGQCVVTVKSRISDFKLNILAIVVPKLTNLLPSHSVEIENYNAISDLILADPLFYQPAAVDMIIGSDFLPLINLDGVRRKISGNLEARESHFGWYLSGPDKPNEVNAFSLTVSPSEDSLLRDQIKRFWELEEVKKESVITETDLFCENYYQTSTKRQSDGRYVVRLPFKKEFPNEIYLGPSKHIALAQYYRMEKTLEKTPDLKSTYPQVLQEYLHLGQIEPVFHRENNSKKTIFIFFTTPCGYSAGK